MNFIKNIFKILGIVAMTFTAVTTSAQSVNDNAGNFPTFQVTDRSLSNSSWSSSTNISPGELLSFRLHYFLNEGFSTSDMRFFMDDLNNRIYEENSSINVDGRVTATGLSSRSGSTRVTFTDRVRLNLYNVSWQIVPCASVGCQESLPDSPNDVLSSSGFRIGEVDGTDSHYAGNLVISFRVAAEDDDDNGGFDPGNDDDVEVETNSATSVDEDSARLNGEIEEGDNVEVSFAISSTDSTPSCSVSSQVVRISGDRDEGDDFSVTVSNLREDTLYYFRACGENNDDEDQGDIRTFRTDDDDNGGFNPGNDDDVEVDTNSATSVDEDSARLNGEVEEGDDVDVFFALSRDDDPSCSNFSDRVNVSGDRDEGDDFSVTVNNLREDTRYFFRACGENNDDEDEGPVRSFTTDDDDGGFFGGNGDDDIEVDTFSATNIEDDSARLRGELEEGDDAEVWFVIASEFGSSPSCSNNSQRVDVDGEFESGDDFFVTVTGLDDDTDYFFRACAEDDNGESDGPIRDFETDGGNGDDAEVTTLTPTSVTDDSARLNGRLDEGDDLEVFFAVSRTDTTPSCSNSSQVEDVAGRFDDGESFSQTITNLRENSTYYYRACAEDEDGEDVFGAIRTFVTGDDGGSTVVSTTQSALTGTATGVSTTFARLNGIASGTGSGECFFNYGTTTAVPLKTNDVSVFGSEACSANLSGLQPNTTYFYQTVLERDGVVRRGAIRSFRTNSFGVTTPPPVVISNPPVVNPPVDPNPGTTIIRVIDTVGNDGEESAEELGVTKWVSGEFDEDFVTAIDARRGEVVFYRVLVRNNSNETLENVEVRDRIPFELELANNNDIDDDTDKQLLWEVEELEPGESRIFITEMRVREDTPVGLEIVSFASAEADGFETDSNNVLIEVVGGSIVGEEIDNNGQGANIFGAGFLPNSLIEWLILLVILAAIAYFVSRLLFSRKESYKLNAELAALEAERMKNLR